MKKRNCWKGAISIFLCIILISNTALIGVLVDGARWRMARAESEAALDSAASSVLSYYNQMLYDLYGLFATDSMSEEQITQLLKEYTEKTLGVAGVPESSVRQINQAIYTALTGQAAAEEGLTPFQPYDFDITVNMSSDRASLANTDAVESQIIDHMKYRAPLSLVSGVGDFLEKLDGLFSVVDRIEAAKDKADSEKELGKEQLAKDAADLIQRISTYNANVLRFTRSPHDPPLAADGAAAKDPMDYVRQFDKELDEKWQELNSNGEPSEDELREAYEERLETLLRTFYVISVNADYYYKEANAIRDEVEPIVKRYEDYIAALQAKIDADPDNENLKTLYLPEIELAKSTCGELLKNIDLVLMGRQYTKNIYDSMADYESMFRGLGSQVLDTRINGLDSGQTAQTGYSIYMEKMIQNDTQPYGHGCKILLGEMKNNLHALNVFGRDFEEAKAAEVKTVTSDGDVSKGKTEPETDGLRPLTEADLQVDYQVTQEVDWEYELNTTVDTDNLSQILQGGLNLIKQIQTVLEGARDSLYINEYAISYFPNYVQHYRAVDEPIATQADNTYLSDKSNSYFVPYNATQAELEYIITGNSSPALGVADVSARLLGIRMVLNTAAIFTDSAKVAQANTLAAAISGPFAPLVATGLLIAWALAESSMDVIDLLSGEPVYLFKQGSNWTISAGGLVRESVEKAADYVGDEVEAAINRGIDNAAAAVEQAANEAVYEAYQKLSAGADEAVSAAQDSMQQWGQELTQQLPPDVQGAVGDKLSSAAGTVSGEASQAIHNLLTDGKDQAMAMVSQTVRSTSKAVKDQVKTLSGAAKEQFTQAVSGALEKILPEGQVQNTGSNQGKGFDVQLNYMDYMRIFLLFMGNTTKVQRIQSLVQANLRYGKQTDFSMAGSFVTVSASMEGSMNYLMMGSGMLPSSMQRDGRLKFKVYTNLGY